MSLGPAENGCEERDPARAPVAPSPWLGRRAARDIRLRPRQPGDDAALFAVFNQPLCREGLITTPFANTEEFGRRLPPDRPHVVEIVAVHRGLVVGYGGVFPSADTRAHVGEISIFVHDGFHRQGVGTLLLAAAIASGEILGRLDRLELIVRSGNARAIAMYRRFGFVVEGSHRGYARLNGVDVDVLSMARLRPALTAN